MKKKLLATAAGFLALAAGAVVAGERGSTALPQDAMFVERSFVGPMIDPEDAFAITTIHPNEQVMSQCVLLPTRKITVTVRQGLLGTYARDGCPRKDKARPCFCDFFVPDDATKRRYEDAIGRYQRGSKNPVPFAIE